MWIEVQSDKHMYLYYFQNIRLNLGLKAKTMETFECNLITKKDKLEMVWAIWWDTIKLETVIQTQFLRSTTQLSDCNFNEIYCSLQPGIAYQLAPDNSQYCVYANQLAFFDKIFGVVLSNGNMNFVLIWVGHERATPKLLSKQYDSTY